MKRLLSVYLSLNVLLLQTGCASIVSGRHQDISVRSNPPGASVEIDGLAVGKTPLTTEAKRKKRHQVKISKEGYLEETRMTKKGYNWWFTGNIILGGIVGIIIDFATGAVYSVSPDELNVSLVQKEGVEPVVQANVEVPKEAVFIASKTADTLNQIEKLGELKTKGLITDNEFEVQKKKLLES